MASREVSPLEGNKSLGLETAELQGEWSLPSPPRRKPQNVVEDASNSPYTVQVPKKVETTFRGNSHGLSSPSILVPETKTVNKTPRSSGGHGRLDVESERRKFLEQLERVDEALKQKKEMLEAKQRSLEYKRRWLFHKSSSTTNGKRVTKVVPKETLWESEIRRILSENRFRAASSHAALQPYFCQVFDDEQGQCERGVFASYPPVALYSSPEEVVDVVKVVESFPVIKDYLASVIREKYEQRLESRKKLLEQFMELREKWIKQLRTSDEQLSKEETEALLQRDCYILIATQGSDVLLARTGSGRTTYRTSASDARNISLEDVGIFLNAIEADGGTAGGRSRWGKCLARIPHQNTFETVFEGGSVWLDDPLAYHHASCAINPWTNNELSVFIKRYAQYGKNFRKIASFLKYKTTEDVVRFYFQNKIRLQLKKYFRGCDVMSKRRMSRKNSFTHNSKVVLETPWSIPSRIGNSLEWNCLEDSPSCKSGQLDSGRESSRSSSPVSSWTFEEVEKLIQGLKNHGTNFKLIAKEIGTKTAMQCRAYWKHNRVTLNMELSNVVGHEQTKVERKKRRRKVLEWSEEEKDAFDNYFQVFGCNWDRLAEMIPTKTSIQIRTYYEELMAASRLDVETERVSPSTQVLHSVTTNDMKTTSTENDDVLEENMKNDSIGEKEETNGQVGGTCDISVELNNTLNGVSPSQSTCAEDTKEVLEDKEQPT